MVRHMPRESTRWRVRVCAHSNAVGGHDGWHVRARPCTEEEGRVAGAVNFREAETDSNQRGAARASRKRTCCASCRERARGGAFACMHTRTALEATTADTSEHGRAPRKRAVSLAQWASVRQEPTPTNAAQRAHAASARAAPPPEREHAVTHSCVRTRERWLLAGGRDWHVGVRTGTVGDGRLAGAVGFRKT